MTVQHVNEAPLAAGIPSPTLRWWPQHDSGDLHSVKLPAFGTFVIGREPGCDLLFHEGVNPASGRFHAVLTVTAGSVEVKDLNSRNGTYVNGARVSEAALGPRDVARVGTICIAIEYPELTAHPTPDPRVVDSDGSFDIYGRLRHEIVLLDSEYGGRLCDVPRRVTDPELARRMRYSAAHIERLVSNLAKKEGVAGRGSKLLQALADRFLGRSRPPAR